MPSWLLLNFYRSSKAFPKLIYPVTSTLAVGNGSLTRYERGKTYNRLNLSFTISTLQFPLLEKHINLDPVCYMPCSGAHFVGGYCLKLYCPVYTAITLAKTAKSVSKAKCFQLGILLIYFRVTMEVLMPLRIT